MIFLDKLKLPGIILPVQQVLAKGWPVVMGLFVSRKAMGKMHWHFLISDTTFNKPTDVNRPNKVLIKIMKEIPQRLEEIYSSQTFDGLLVI